MPPTIAPLDSKRRAFSEEMRALSQTAAAIAVASIVSTLSAEEIDALRAEVAAFSDGALRIAARAAETVVELPDLAGDPHAMRRQVTDEEMLAADAGWAAARARGVAGLADAEARIGPFLLPAEVARRLGVTPETVRQWRGAGLLLAIERDRRGVHYPAWQFVGEQDGESRPIPGLADALAAMADRPEWTQAQLLLAPTPALRGERPLDVLRAGRPGDARRVVDWLKSAGEPGS